MRRMSRAFVIRITTSPAAASRRLGRLCGVLLVLLAASTASAQQPADEPPDYARDGFYVQVSGIFATDLFEDEIGDALLPAGFEADIDPTFGVGARVGARFLRVLAIELDYEWLEDYDIDVGLVGGGNLGGASLEQQTLTANLRLFAPIGRFQPYLLAGAGFQRLELDLSSALPVTVTGDGTDTVFAGRVGLGFDVYLTENLALSAEGLVVLTNEEVDVNLGFGDQTISNIFYAGARWGATWRF